MENRGDTIFDRLSAAGLPWKIYYDPLEVLSLTVMVHPRLWDHLNHVHFMSTFYHDVAHGTLPAYSFIEPRMMFRHNDAHPPSNVVPADQLLGQIYNAIRNSKSPTGSNYQNTLLIVTFDEHGGTYDHVPPPGGAMATPPLAGAPAGQYGFRFDRLGIRVPTILISPYVDAGTIIKSPLTHTSVIRTLCEQWGLPSLTLRDANSPVLNSVINRSTPRDLADLPIGADHGSLGDAPDNRHQPLTGIQKDIVGLVARYAPPPNEEITTVGQAHDYLKASGRALGLGGRTQYFPLMGRAASRPAS